MTGKVTPTDLLWMEPERVMLHAGFQPDPWQGDLLRSQKDRILLLCSRQAGKSQVAAALALLEAILSPPALILLLSPTERQSGELFRQKFMPLFRALPHKPRVTARTQLTLELANGSRIVSLPESEEGIRGFSSVSLLVIDEAATVDDQMYSAVRPMLAVSRGRLVALSTPRGKRGWFYEAWTGSQSWHRVQIKAEQCPRIPKEFLAEELATHGERYFRQEYCTSFEDAVGSAFDYASIEAAFSGTGGKPLFGS